MSGRGFRQPVSVRALGRRAPSLPPRACILVVCEDGKSSRLYFEDLRAALRLTSVEVDVLSAYDSRHTDPLGIVQYARERRSERQREARRSVGLVPYDEVYCVVDADGQVQGRGENLGAARHAAEEASIHLIVSNPCFEVWYLLHGGYSTRPYRSYDDLKLRLREVIPGYDKATHVFAVLAQRLEQALVNATRLARHGHDTGSDNPATDVHKLVQRLRELSRAGA